MICLNKIKSLSEREDYDCAVGYSNLNIYNELYPFKIFPNKELYRIEFIEMTILYGGNGSWKSTLLNIIADKIHVNKKQQFQEVICLKVILKNVMLICQ